MGLSVRDVMQRDVHTVGPRTRVSELPDQFVAHRVNGLPVVDDGRLVGIVSRSDVVGRLAVEQSLAGYVADFYRHSGPFDSAPDEHAETRAVSEEVGARLAQLHVGDVMVTSVVTVSPDEPVESAAKQMVDRRIHRVPVVEDGRLVGIVSALDLARLVAEGHGRTRRLMGRGVYPHEHADHLLNPLRRLVMPPGMLVRRLGLRPTDRVLEVGPGPGYFSPSVARAVPQGRLVLCDLQPQMLERASARLRDAGLANFETQQGSADALPFPDESFDVAFLVAVLGEVPDPSLPDAEQARALERALSECRRVVRPGGLVSVTEVPGDPDFVPEARVRELAERAGLEPVRRMGVRWFYTLNLRRPR